MKNCFEILIKEGFSVGKKNDNLLISIEKYCISHKFEIQYDFDDECRQEKFVNKLIDYHNNFDVYREAFYAIDSTNYVEKYDIYDGFLEILSSIEIALQKILKENEIPHYYNMEGKLMLGLK